jgi:hypothetical protein
MEYQELLVPKQRWLTLHLAVFDQFNNF